MKRIRNIRGFREKPLPPALSCVDTDEYQDVGIDAQSPLYSEPLVKLEDFGIATLPYYAQESGLNAPLSRRVSSAMTDVFVRASIARRLQKVNEKLGAIGVELLVWDGYRPIAVQAELWSWMLEEAKARFPDAEPAEQEAFALRFASNPSAFDASDPKTWPTHSTGGAVDLTLQDAATKTPLFMGGIYLDSSDVTATRHFESAARNDPASDQEAQRNRRLLFWTMDAFGFVNYAFEWWHFDYMTQAWVMNQGNPDGLKARYGLANAGRVVA